MILTALSENTALNLKNKTQLLSFSFSSILLRPNKSQSVNMNKFSLNLPKVFNNQNKTVKWKWIHNPKEEDSIKKIEKCMSTSFQ